MNETNKQRFVRTLREVAEYIESRPFDEDLQFIDPDFYVHCTDKNQFGEAAAAAGNFEKSSDGEYLHATINFGYTKFQIEIAKEFSCRRVKVGEKVIPATEEHTVPAEPERVEDVYKYECPESFLALKDEAASAVELKNAVTG